MSTLTVLGSLNVDQIVTVPGLPAAGETVLARDLLRRPGGKGANQAVAAARAGASVRMVGATGDDEGGRLLRAALVDDGIDVDAVRRVPDAPTGLAVVSVQDDGENTITVVSGANGLVGDDDVHAACEGLDPGDTLVLQLEIPLAAVADAARRAAAVGARVLLNAAPAPRPDSGSEPVLGSALGPVDVLVVNEHECRVLAGGGDEGPQQAAAALAEAHDALVVVTLGARGAAWTAGGPIATQQAPDVRAVDTTGAGDTFTGYLAAALHDGADPADAVRLAVTAASTAVTRLGAQEGIPRRADL